MLILSQDKTFILNFNNIESIEIGNFEENRGKGIIYARLTSDYFYTIGEFNTIERAKEVLQEIISFYFQTEYFKSICNISYISSEQLNETQEKILVYEMPEK